MKALRIMAVLYARAGRIKCSWGSSAFTVGPGHTSVTGAGRSKPQEDGARTKADEVKRLEERA